jgi:isoleucyl-tRNA synthetase
MYEKVSTKLDFTSREEKVLKFWKENEIFEKSIEEKTCRLIHFMTALQLQTASRISAMC